MLGGKAKRCKCDKGSFQTYCNPTQGAQQGGAGVVLEHSHCTSREILLCVVWYRRSNWVEIKTQTSCISVYSSLKMRILEILKSVGGLKQSL